jgi:hypothetical protein
MDGTRFDRLTRLMAGGTTRRRALGVMLGAAIAGAAVADSAANPTRPTVCRKFGVSCSRNAQCCTGLCATDRALPRRQRHRCSCPAGLLHCDGACVDATADEANCGACGLACASDELCCSGTCAAVTDDENNCGACGNICNDEGTCVDGVCKYPDFCLASWGSTFCFQDAEGGIHTNEAYFAHGKRNEDVTCVTSADCTGSALCDRAGLECVCMTLERWDAGVADYQPYDPGICVAADATPECRSNPFVGTGWGCVESVEGDLYNPTVAFNTNFTYCTASSQCESFSSACSEPGITCACMGSYRSNVGTFANPLWSYCVSMALAED